MSRKNMIRKPDTLVLLALIVTLGAVMSTTVQAAEPFQFKPQPRLANLADVLEESGYRVTSLGNTRAGMHVSMVPPATVEEGYPASGDSNRGLKNMSEVYLSVRLPW
jgi:hypothetical protein